MFEIEPTEKEIEYLTARNQNVLCVDTEPGFETFKEAARSTPTFITLERYIDLMMNEINSTGTENKENTTWVTNEVYEIVTTKPEPKS